MKPRRTWLLLVFATLALVPLLSPQPGTLKEIAPGVWFREGEIEDQGHCNNVIIEMKDYLVVIDANFPSGARLVLADAKRVSKKPVKYVFDTHHHGDHAYGNPVWTKAGATTLAHAGVVDEMKRYEPSRWRDAAKERKDVGELGLSEAEPPRQTFDRSPYVLDDGSRRVEFHHFGWAHTRGDGFAYLPNEKILCTGDAIVNGPWNYTGDGNVGGWPKVIEQAQKLEIARVLPGHGPPAGREVMEGQKQFFIELRKAASKATKLQDLVTLKDGKPGEAVAKLPANVQKWVGPFHADQLRDAFEEVRQGKPRGDLKLD
ncbi:MAG: MBL fold metallo-hydrolase [Bryobacteraceae bacterium]|nr:MBL fold metallo-hydrolase [Bryobacteraceae bacterium]